MKQFSLGLFETPQLCSFGFRCQQGLQVPLNLATLYSDATWTLIHWCQVTHICVSEVKPPYVKLVACRCVALKPVSKPMLAYCQLDLRNVIQWNCIWKSKVILQQHVFENSSAKWRPFYPGLNVLMRLTQQANRLYIQVLNQADNNDRQHWSSPLLVLYVGNPLVHSSTENVSMPSRYQENKLIIS